MNYEKKYKEALEKAREIIKDYENRGLKDNLFYAKEDFEAIFPELKEESEDEKVKRILHSISSKMSFHLRDIFTEEEFQCFDVWSNAWLKKQKKPEDMVHITELKVWPANSATTANRQLYNRAILKLLSDYVEKYPDIRFGQMLCNLGIGPVFNEESQEIYLKLNETINKQK